MGYPCAFTTTSGPNPSAKPAATARGRAPGRTRLSARSKPTQSNSRARPVGRATPSGGRVRPPSRTAWPDAPLPRPPKRRWRATQASPQGDGSMNRSTRTHRPGPPRGGLRRSPMAHARTTSTVWAPAALAALAGLLYGKGHLGYDASWALVWGEQIASGHVPRFQAPGAPTPHPLANIATALLAPLGGTAGSAHIR